MKQNFRKRKSLFSYLERFLLRTPLSTGISPRYMPLILYIFFLMLLYVGNSHYHQKVYREIYKLEKEVEDLRVSYITLKSSCNFNLKHSEILKKLKQFDIDLEECTISPYKVFS